MTAGVAMVRPTLRRKLVGKLRELDRRAGKYDRTRRLRELIDQPGSNDWGHRLMTLVGRNDSGTWGPPRVQDLYYRQVWEYDGVDPADPWPKPTGQHLETTRHAMTAWNGATGRDGRRTESWFAFDSQDDGHTIRIGRLGDDGRLHDTGIEGREVHALFRRWLMWDGWVKAEWFGLRPWLYYKGLSAAVDDRRPFTCQRMPDEGAGGYRHWHCHVPVGLRGTLRRWAGHQDLHDDAHRYGNYRWVEGQQVEYDPRDLVR